MTPQKNTELAEKWLLGQQDVEGYNEIVFTEKQKLSFNAKERHNLVSGGLSSGKTLSQIIIKSIILANLFPGSRTIIGRKSKENAQNTFLKDFQEIVPPDAYELQVGQGKIIWPNGSSSEFWGLDSLVSGDDTGKSPQKLKSHNFHFAFLDQLEEIDKDLYDSLTSRVRARMCKHEERLSTHFKKKGQIIFSRCELCKMVSFNQINSTINPANHWAHEFFKASPHLNSHLVETSMLENPALSEAYVQNELSKPKRWVDRFVYGKWENWGDVEKLVFLEEHLHQQRHFEKRPVRELNGIKIFHEPAKHNYQIGHDPSEGSQDPSATVVFDKSTGEIAATFRAYCNVSAQADRVKQMAEMYSLVGPPLVVPEANGVGAAFVELLKVRYAKIYERETYNQRESKVTNKLGWNTSMSSKALLIEHAKTLFDRSFLKIRDKQVVDEMLQFEYSDVAAHRGAGAKAGSHDDMVMAFLLAVWNCEPVTKQGNDLLSFIKNKEPKRIKYQYT